jgi:hypothetical protein
MTPDTCQCFTPFQSWALLVAVALPSVVAALMLALFLAKWRTK